MTPRTIAILMHYYANQNTTDYVDTRGDITSKSWAQEIRNNTDHMVTDGLLQDNRAANSPPTDMSTQFSITDKGKVMAKYILNVPLPLPHTGWKVPRT